MTLRPCLLLLATTLALAAQEVVVEEVETAGMSLFRGLWDTPLVLDPAAPLDYRDDQASERGGTAEWTREGGALAFDALNRFALVRFPGAAEQLAAALGSDHRIAKLELVLPWRDDEIQPPGKVDWYSDTTYAYRLNWGVGAAWRENRPTWHAVAVPLRRAWTADPEHGPTLNAAVNGRVHWTDWGAGDPEHDRFPIALEPAEVSHRQTEGRIDLTPLLGDERYGADLADRLRTLADCGFLLRKLETYDHRYFNGVYEWATATGGRAIAIHAPRLVATLEPAQRPVDLAALPPAADPLAAEPSGAPTAVMPSDEQLAGWVERYAIQGHPDMPDWQRERAAELALLEVRHADAPLWEQFVVGHVRNKIRDTLERARKAETSRRRKAGELGADESLPRDEAAVRREIYAAWVDQLIARAPRGWSGFESARAMTEWNLGREILPGPAQHAIARYWTAWLMPERDAVTDPVRMMDPDDTSGDLVHPMADQLAQRKGTANQVSDTYYAQTGDWRGNKSFFRGGFCYVMSTQNFNTTAAAGSLLAGKQIGAERAMTDGRNGVEEWLARQWAWGDGSTQEHIDHYYFSVTLKGQKALYDYAPTPYDRLLARSILAASMEELISAWHPELRRFVAGASRTALAYHLGTQDGLHFIMHSLSRRGALTDVDQQEVAGMKVWGHETPARVVALQLRNGPYAEDWATDLIDDKALPWQAWHRNGDAVRHAHLGPHGGRFTRSDGEGRSDSIGYWRRSDQPVESVRDLVFLDTRFGANDSNFVNNASGWIAHPGSQAHLQDGGLVATITSPRAHGSGIRKGVDGGELRSLQSAIALFDQNEAAPDWRITIDGEAVESLPARATQGQVIVVEDGVSWFGVIPLPASDLGRDVEVLLRAGTPQESKHDKLTHSADLVIESFLLRGEEPVGERDADWWYAVDRAHGGFITVLGDAGQYADVEAFRRAVAAIEPELTVAEATNTVALRFAFGGKQYELDTVTAAPRKEEGGWDDLNGRILRRLIDGIDPYPADVTRDTPSVQYGRERAAKAGAVLTASNRREPVEPPPAGAIPWQAQVGHRAHIALRHLPGTRRWIAWNPLPDLCEWRLEFEDGAVVTADARLPLCRIDVDREARRIVAEVRFEPGQAADPQAARHLRLHGLDDHVLIVNGAEVAAPADDAGWRSAALGE